MKAAVFEQYGSPAQVLHIQDVDQPAPKEGEILVKIEAASVNAADWHLLRADPFFIRLVSGLIRPKFGILGGDIAGIVQAVGKDVKSFKVGDEVFGDISGCGFGGFAEYVCVPETAVMRKPKNVTFDQAAATPMAAVTALKGLKEVGKLQANQEVLVLGASGGVGMFAVQIAKAMGAKVSAVASTQKLDLLESIGADHIVDYNKQDPTELGPFDLVFDAAAYRSILDYRKTLKPRGTYVMAGGSISRVFQLMFLAPWISLFHRKKFRNYVSNPNREQLEAVRTLLESGKLAPVIDREFSLDETAAAIRYVEERKVKGKVLVKPNP